MPTFQERAIVADKFDEFGFHPRCRRCLLLEREECEFPQYDARGAGDFYCADFKEKEED